MRILDKYIIKSFLIPFFATFLVVLFVLVMQILWQDFDKIAGRGLGISVVFEFLGYTALMVLPTALSIGILLSSIMALGNLSENYEYAAIKSSGISLIRMLRPLIILMLILSALNFLYLNFVFPFATFEGRNLVNNMRKKQPAMALVAGSFNNDIPDFKIKFSEKYGEENNLLKDVLIYDLRNTNYNSKVITAKYGKITSTPGSKYMALILKDGFYMEDIAKKGVTLNKDNMPFIKSSFKEYQINFDISTLDEMSDSKSENHHEMMSINQLTDFVSKKEKPIAKELKNNIKRYFQQVKAKKLIADTLDLSKYNFQITKNFDAKNKLKILKNAKRDVSRILTSYRSLNEKIKKRNSYINKFKTEYHRRIAFAFACIVLFLVGAPLGSLIKKGGFGIPMLLAILIFVIYFFVGVLAKGMAISGTISPILGGWLSTIIMLPFGLFLLNKAVKDKGSNFSITSKIGNLFKYFKKKNKTEVVI